MVSAVSERVELAKLCSSRDWSKAIRVLDSLLAQSCAIQDLCNRAFCYSQLELHKHVIKDCDKALKLDPSLLQAYILKGRAFSAVGRKDEALFVWEQGYKHALQQSTDLRQLLELEDLLTVAKQDKQERSLNCEKEDTDLRLPKSPSESRGYSNGKSSEVFGFDSNGINSLPVGDSHQLRPVSSTSSSELVSHNNGETDEGYKSNNELHDRTKTKLSYEPTHASEIHSKSGHKSKAQSGLSDKACVNDTPHNQINGTSNIDDKPSSSYHSEQSPQLPTISSNSSDRAEISGKSSYKFRLRDEISDEAKWNMNFNVTRISKTKSISVDFRLSRGISQVNEGNYAYAISIFDQMLKEDPTYPEALIGRGTAYAFQRELEAAIADFTKAIESNPAAGEAWKRRGQARAALGEFAEAVNDLTKALEFEPNSADILHERGIVNFKFKDFSAAVEDLSACVKLDQDNKSAYTYWGLALSSIGEYGKAEEAHLKSIQLDQSFLEAWAHLTQLYQDLAILKKALECLQQVMQIDGRYAKAYQLRGQLFHGMGEHRKAIKDLSLGLSIDNSNIECLYLRASCYHAVGEYREAVKDYDAALDVELDSMDKFVLQCLAFYQKEIALYTASKVNSDFCWFDIDGDIDPLFKEYWCKRLHPKEMCEKVYRQPPLRDSLKKGKLRKQDFTITKQKTALLLAADSIGKKIQYECPGFLPNRRQHRMAGLAAIEIAQKVSKAWRSLQADKKCSNKSSRNGKRLRRRERIGIPSQNRGGACCSTSSSSEISTSYGITEDRTSGRSVMSWQDVYSLAVKWRQISEPCDPVVWVNKLSEEFNSGFGSETPMVLGQSKVVRYFPNYERTLNIAKTIMKDKQFVNNKADKIIDLSDDRKSQEIIDAKSCEDLYKIVGEDFWLATWCRSAAFEGKQLEGTRITLVKTGDRGYDFAIKTPCTPSRWDDFETEMEMAWEALCNAYCGETYGSTDFAMLENVRDAILRMTYYWYNFMPLSRGTAVVGFVVLLGLLLAANMEFTGNIPKDLQVDWEAILNFEPNLFVDSVKSWLYPSLKVTTSWKAYPDVSSTFLTTGSVVAALSSYDDRVPSNNNRQVQGSGLGSSG